MGHPQLSRKNTLAVGKQTHKTLTPSLAKLPMFRNLGSLTEERRESTWFGGHCRERQVAFYLSVSAASPGFDSLIRTSSLRANELPPSPLLLPFTPAQAHLSFRRSALCKKQKQNPRSLARSFPSVGLIFKRARGTINEAPTTSKGIALSFKITLSPPSPTDSTRLNVPSGGI